jgi:hypothetical protein
MVETALKQPDGVYLGFMPTDMCAAQPLVRTSADTWVVAPKTVTPQAAIVAGAATKVASPTPLPWIVRALLWTITPAPRVMRPGPQTPVSRFPVGTPKAATPGTLSIKHLKLLANHKAR